MSLTLKWFPRSWVYLEFDGMVIYIDPAYIKTYFHHCPTRVEYACGPGEDDGLPEPLPKGDLILITHGHKDHCKNITVDRLSDDGTLICAPKSCVKELDRPYRVVKPGESFRLKGIGLEVVEAYNMLEGHSFRKVHKKGAGVGYLLTLGPFRLYHAGDTDFIPSMSDLNNIDLAFLPIGGTFTMDIAEAVQATLALNPRWVVPVHHLNAEPSHFAAAIKHVTPAIKVKLPVSGEALMF